jgi:hypothetical protein
MTVGDAWALFWSGDGLDDRFRGVAFLLFIVLLLLWLLSYVLPQLRGFLPAKETSREVTSRPTGPFHGFGARAREALTAFADARINLFAAMVVVGLLFALLSTSSHRRWVALLAAIPSLLVLVQYVYLWLQRPEEVKSEENEESGENEEKAGVPAQRTADTPNEPKPGRQEIQDRYVRGAQRQVELAIESNYSARVLFIRYGFPALILLVEATMLGYVVVDPDTYFTKVPQLIPADTWTQVVRGARFGAVGAYAWVLVELWRRTARHDVTSGAALSCVAVLALGPVMAGTVALLWKPDTTAMGWQSGIVLFYAGFSPRAVVGLIAQAAAQMLRKGAVTAVESRSTPLTRLRGVTPEVAERLDEEGIANVEMLATADPIRLLRNTCFDLRQILWWMDEALLMMYSPRWQDLESNGITGAIDLAAMDTMGEDGGGVLPIPDLSKLLAVPESLVPDFVARIRLDEQVRNVWYLYNFFVSDGRRQRS